MLLTAVQVFSSLAIVALVLLQRGKGAEAGAGFGAGASGTVFGARGASTALSRATAVFAAIFMINSLALAYLGTTASKERQKTILEEAADTGKTAPATGSAPPSPPAQAPPVAPATAPASTPAPAPAPAPAPK
ncbi:MAG TPA: preprotein translocase subunit SecG [Steroidobacteraceae bacterium]|jgi:preprotein translocase subunit SecG